MRPIVRRLYATRRRYEELDAAGAAVFADALRDWPKDDVVVLATLLTRLADRLTINSVIDHTR